MQNTKAKSHKKKQTLTKTSHLAEECALDTFLSTSDPLLPLPSKSFTTKWLEFRHVIPPTLPEGGVVLYEGVSPAEWTEFAAALSNKETPALALRYLRYDEDMCRIFIVELPKERHEVSHDFVQSELVEQGHRRFIHGVGGGKAKFINREADGAWRPVGLCSTGSDGQFPPWDEVGNPYPTIVLEVGLSESVQQLRRDACLWLSPPSTVQVVLLVKIHERRIPESRRAPSFPFPEGPAVDMLFEMHFREDVHVVRGRRKLGEPPRVQQYFGTYGNQTDCAPLECDRAGLEAFQVHAPGRLIYHGDPVLQQDPLPAPVASGFTFDLFDLQQCILRSK